MRPGFLRIGGFLDRYVAKLFAQSYLAAFLLVVGLVLILELAAGIDDYLEPDENGEAPPLLLVVEYFLLRIPFLYLDMSPYVTLVAGLFTATKLTRFREVVAALAAGVSVRRLFAPVLLGATLLAGGMFLLREWATTSIGQRRAALHDRLKERREAPVLENFFVVTPTGQRVQIQEYHVGDREIRRLTCQFRDGERQVRVFAQRATPLEGGRWQLEGAERRELDANGLSKTAPTLLEDVRFETADVELSYRGRNEPMTLSFRESRGLLEREPRNRQYRTLLHHHMSFPLAGVVLLLVGLPFVVRQERGKAGERVAKGFFLCLMYFGIEFVFRTLGLQGQIPPLFSAWLPVLGFGALGSVLFFGQRS